MMKTFCDHCEVDCTDQPMNHLVTVTQPVLAKRDLGLTASAEQSQRVLGVFCLACTTIMVTEAERLVRSRVAAVVAADDGA